MEGFALFVTICGAASLAGSFMKFLEKLEERK